MNYIKFLFVLLLFMTSCNKDYNTVGVDLIDNKPFNTDIEEVPVFVKMNKIPPYIANAISTFQLGIYEDNIYGKSKVEMEKCILRSGLNFPWVIIRPTSIWGPWFGEPYNNFFHFVLRKMFVHPGNMGCEKTYGYIGNSVFQILKLLEIEDESLVKGKTFYICLLYTSDAADE